MALNETNVVILIDDSDEDEVEVVQHADDGGDGGGNVNVNDYVSAPTHAAVTSTTATANNNDNNNNNNDKVHSLMAIMNLSNEATARTKLHMFDNDLEQTIAHLLDESASLVARPTQQQQQHHDATTFNNHDDSKPEARRSLFAGQSVARRVEPTNNNSNNNSNSSANAAETTTTTTTLAPHKLSSAWHEAYQRTVQMGQEFFIDSDFAPITASLDGRARPHRSIQPTTGAGANQKQQQDATVIRCACGVPAAPRTVQSDGPNYGRFYLACGQQRKRRAQVVVVARSSPEQKKQNEEKDEVVPDDKTRPAVFNPYAKKKPQTPSKVTTAAAASTAAVPKSPPQRSNCNFFQWDADGSAGAAGYKTRYSLLAWQHFGVENRCCLYRKSIDPSQVRQGAVGNCWFLSALAVVAEKQYLVRQLLPHDGLNDKGCYQVNLCLDGAWTPVIVDSNLPVVLDDMSKKKGSPVANSKSLKRGGVPWKDHGGGGGGGGGSCNLVAYPAFCAAPNHQLWPGLVEKAYAKAHGSYAQLSGGFIAEGLTDLTGAPCETVVFAAGMFDPEELWVRLLSFAEAGFLMGVATSQGGDGLVGGHAYSLLDVVEVHDSIVGEQSKVTDYFKGSPVKKKAKTSLPESDGNVEQQAVPRERTTVRLVRIRNPWGTREWKGDWSADSERWTKALRKRLGGNTFVKGDGTFFMSYPDMLERFHHMDIAKTREGWTYSSVEGVFERNRDPLACSRFVYRLTPSARTWAYVSLVQPKKRSNTQSKYWYCDPSMLILKKKPHEDEWTCEARAVVGVKRVSHCEVFLDPEYMYCCVPLSCVAHKSDTVDFDFRLTIYSASSVAVEQRNDCDNCRRGALSLLHKELLRREEKLLYPVASSGLLGCVHGDGCLLFFAINGSHDHFISMRLMVEVSDGILIVFGTNEDTHDVAPRSQRILLVLSQSGKSSATTQLNFRYLSSTVPVTGAKAAVPGRVAQPTRLGNTLDLTLAGDLLTGTFDSSQVSNKGGDTIDTYAWIPQIGSSST